MLGFLNADHYHAQAKDAIIMRFLSQLPAGEKVLDVGAGQMPYKKYCGHLRYMSQDFGKYDGAGDGKGLQVGKFSTSEVDVLSDITEIPLPDKSQDNIICTEVLEHIFDPSAAIREMNRLLRPNGRILISVPGTSFLHFSPYHYYTGFKDNYFEKAFLANGLKIVEIHKTGSVYTEIALYLWFVMHKLAKCISPWKSRITFQFLVAAISPIILVLLGVDRVGWLKIEGLEAGLTVIGIKTEEK